MKLLLDACVWGGTCTELRSHDHDVVWAGDWPENPTDDEILERAYGEGRILVTLDKDFGELAIVRGAPHAGIIRLVNLPARQQGLACLRVLRLYGNEIKAGTIITVEPDRIRIRTT